MTSQQPQAGAASKEKTFSFQKQLYVLPDTNTVVLTKVQLRDLTVKLKACNSRLPPVEQSLAFRNAAFDCLKRRDRGSLSDVELRRVISQWKEKCRAYKAILWKIKKRSTPGTQQVAQTRREENIVIDSQDYQIRFKRKLLKLGFQSFATSFMAINPNHPRQDFTPSVLEQAFDAYISRFRNLSSDMRQEMMQRKKSKRARAFLKQCAILAVRAKARVEKKAATCSADSGSSGGETETDGDESRDAVDGSDGDGSDIPQGIVPAADHPAASTSTESVVEGRSSIQGSTEDDGDGSSVTTSNESEVETQEVVADTDEQASESPSDHSSYDKMDIDEGPHDLQVEPRKRQRESTSSPSTHPPRAKRLRVAESPTPASSDTSIKHYGPGLDIFSALEEHLNIWSEKYNVEIASMARRYNV